MPPWMWEAKSDFFLSLCRYKVEQLYQLDLDPDDRYHYWWLLGFRQSLTGIFYLLWGYLLCHQILQYKGYLTSSVSSHWALCFAGVTYNPGTLALIDFFFYCVSCGYLVRRLKVAQWILSPLWRMSTQLPAEVSVFNSFGDVFGYLIFLGLFKVMYQNLFISVEE